MIEQERQAWREILRTDDPKEFLMAVVNNPGIAMEDRIEAAVAVMVDNTRRALALADEAAESTD